MSESLCYVAALVYEPDRPTFQPLEDLGFKIMQVQDPPGWCATFARLASVLGLAS